AGGVSLRDRRTAAADPGGWAIIPADMHREQTPKRVAFPLPARLLGIPGVQALELEVVDVADLGTRMRRIWLGGSALAKFGYQAGQDVMLVLGGTPDRPLSRR